VGASGATADRGAMGRSYAGASAEGRGTAGRCAGMPGTVPGSLPAAALCRVGPVGSAARLLTLSASLAPRPAGNDKLSVEEALSFVTLQRDFNANSCDRWSSQALWILFAMGMGLRLVAFGQMMYQSHEQTLLVRGKGQAARREGCATGGCVRAGVRGRAHGERIARVGARRPSGPPSPPLAPALAFALSSSSRSCTTN
jgi:hypothetical protein